MVTLVAWKEDRFAQSKFQASDTVPIKSEKKIKNIDEAIEELFCWVFFFSYHFSLFAGVCWGIVLQAALQKAI